MRTCLQPAPAGAYAAAVMETTPDRLTEYLFDLDQHQYAAETIIERMNALREWRAFGMTDDLAELYLFLDQYPTREDRLRRFNAVRAYTRWLFERGLIPVDWTAAADLGGVVGL